MPARVLVVDDDAPLAEMISIIMNGEGFEVECALNGRDALEKFEQWNPDLVLLDVMLPGLSGIAICELIRSNSLVPIIMLTARSDPDDVVAGLEAGADDYVPKPFNPKELVARVKARLRSRPEEPAEERLELGDLKIDVSGHAVSRGGEKISLTPLEFDLLVTLARSPWRVFGRQELLQRVWGYKHAADTRLVNVHVQRLRSKIEPDPENPQLVVTVRGIGYRAGVPNSAAAVSGTLAGTAATAHLAGQGGGQAASSPDLSVSPESSSSGQPTS